jgi:hypothetical protein
VQLRGVPAARFDLGDAIGGGCRLSRAKERGGQCDLRVAVRAQLGVPAREREGLGGSAELQEVIDRVADAGFGKGLEALAINGLGALDPFGRRLGCGAFALSRDSSCAPAGRCPDDVSLERLGGGAVAVEPLGLCICSSTTTSREARRRKLYIASASPTWPRSHAIRPRCTLNQAFMVADPPW